MALTPEEKQAGRLFRDTCQAELVAQVEAKPPTYIVPNWIAVYRHPCPARGNRSTALELHEVYRQSPEYPQYGVPAGRFGFIARAGSCRACGHTAGSRAGRLVDARERPPLWPTR